MEAGGWRLEAGSWKLEAGSWKLEAGGWMPVAGKCRPLNSEGDSRGGRAPPSCARPVACDPWRAVRLGPTAACALVPRIERG
ncbi:hypothetical protein [Burkholderia pseudomallei]|uniref:hypothetical protein n=1 Tax=Burkholderia pseudomallei TaxID=28450 RepID=UPI003C7B1B1A